MKEFTLKTYIVELSIIVEANSDTVALTDSLRYMPIHVFKMENLINMHHCVQNYYNIIMHLYHFQQFQQT
jgi:hypothetical protein